MQPRSACGLGPLHHRGGPPGDSYSVARDLLNQVIDKDGATWRASTPVDWANESFAISISPKIGYCVGTGTGCWYDQDNERLDEGEPKRTVLVDRAYIETHTPTVREQLVKAGVRLAGLLNQALDD